MSLTLTTNDRVDAITSSFNSFRFDKQLESTLSDLSATDPTFNHLKARRKYQKGTGAWFISSEQYMKWVTTADSFLWINGIPGCGKTILCSITIEDLHQNRQSTSPQTGIAYYFFNFQTKAEQQFVNLLRSIILQLFRQRPNLPKSVRRLVETTEPDHSSERLMTILRDFLESFPKVYIVIDAFDECDQSEEVLRWIQELVKSKGNRLHLLVSSRQDHQLRSALKSFTTSILALNESSFEEDIQIYIRGQMNTDPRMKRWPSGVQNDIEQSLIANARGLFRWVDCQLDVLRNCLRVNNINGVLNSPPTSLNETYDRIISSIDEAYAEDACKILQWLAFSARPLRMKELNEVLAFERSDPQNPIFSPQLRLPLVDDVLTLCSSLVTVSAKETTDQSDSDIGSMEVRLAHHSVKDYLVSLHIRSRPSKNFAQEAKLAHSVIAECCLVYLLQFHSPLDMAMLREYPLAPYAAEFWTEHYRHSEHSDGDLLDLLSLRIFTAETVYQNCCYLYNPDRRWQGCASRRYPGLPALYYASLTGLSRIVLLLLADGADPNQGARGCSFGDALSAAAYKGDEDTVQALLGAGTKPDGGEWGSDYGSPIASAASQGHNRIVARLLKAGADIHKKGEDGQGPALYHGVVYTRLETAKILLDAGAKADAYHGMSGAAHAIDIAAIQGDRELVCLLFPKVYDGAAEGALEWIAQEGHRELFETLLRTHRGREMGLQYAASAGWNDLVQSIIDERSRVLTEENSMVAAFCQAARSGSLETIQILYESREESALSVDEPNMAIESAAIKGNSLVVKYLLDRGADTNSPECQKGIVRAAENGHLSTVQVLLTAGVSSNSYFNDRWLARKKLCLWAAVEKEYVDIARLLLSFGADPNVQYRDIRSCYNGESNILNVSIARANEDLFDLLLEKGASTDAVKVKNARYDSLTSPIHYAASVGSIYILRRLLEMGLEVTQASIPDGWTAIFHAAEAGHDEVLRVLIRDYHVDVGQRANKGTVAIHTAAYHNHAKCIEVFLDADLDVNVRDCAGRTSLHWAADEGSIDAVRILLERGADVLLEETDTFMKAADIA